MWISVKTAGAAALALLVLSACVADQSYSSRGVNESSFPMRWDHVPQADEWETAGLAALESHAAILPEIVPADIDRWCPAYPDADAAQRRCSTSSAPTDAADRRGESG